jgi:hypothetical protein
MAGILSAMLRDIARVFSSQGVLIQGTAAAPVPVRKQPQGACDHKGSDCRCFAPRFDQAAARLELSRRGRALHAALASGRNPGEDARKGGTAAVDRPGDPADAIDMGAGSDPGGPQSSAGGTATGYEREPRANAEATAGADTGAGTDADGKSVSEGETGADGKAAVDGGTGAASAGKAPAPADGKKDAQGKPLGEEERKQVRELEKRDREVKAHEAAHKAAAGGHARGGANFEYETGPDGRRYAVGGHVDIDVSPVQGNPRATLQKAMTVQRAALAPADPSGQDRAVAAAAAQMALQARKDLAAGGGDAESGSETGVPAPRAGSAGRTAGPGRPDYDARVRAYARPSGTGNAVNAYA